MKVQVPRCSLCGRRAIVSLPYARLRLCEEHFEKFMLKRVKRVDIPRNLILGLSGGKDSVVLAYLLKRLGYNPLTVTVDTVPYYSTVEARVAKKVAEELQLEHITVHAKELYGFTALDYRKFKRTPCGLCSKIRRHALDLIGTRLGKDYVATGHNLDDVLQVALSSLIFGKPEELRKAKAIEEKLKGTLGRVKPLFWIPERDILAFALSKRLTWLKERCPLYYTEEAVGDKIRLFLHELEDSNPSTKLKLMNNILKISNAFNNKKVIEAKLCKYCRLRSYGEVCSICKLRLQASRTNTTPPKNPRMEVYGDGNIAVVGQGWIKWVYADTKGKRVRQVLYELGLKRETAVMTFDGKPLPYEATFRSNVDKGEVVIYVVTRISPSRIYPRARQSSSP
ncbi:hypothetical protein IPA_09515 [Ignicoccus pacificus DSM 13166]|uniref:TIGR00269 family protein n=1 Tax=Ignicoccus pacificus DSM 13166 TaxID=940294 RepID=A0A977PLC4_9CREN|nr:hypothetical protein IPA_09515 [Ignicoccus pacificus DSM 13166]